MGLYTVTKNQPSAAADLDQVVNLLNGTTTTVPVAVSNRISARLSGATTASALVGGYYGPPYGAGTFAVGDLVIDAYFDMLWTCYGATSGTYPQGTWQSMGTGGYVARWHQANQQTLSTGSFVPVYLDTPDFDPQAMYSTSVSGYVIPITGQWAFSGAVHRRAGSPSNRLIVTIYHNGSEAARGFDGTGSSFYGGGDVTAELTCSQGDVVQLLTYQQGSSAGTTDASLSALNYFTASFVGAQLQ
jgi:hypothetical protein